MSLFFSRGERRVMSAWFTNDQAERGAKIITPDTATYLGPVFASLRHIVDFTATLPVDAFRREDKKRRSEIALPQLLARLEDRFGIGVGPWFGQAAYGIASVGNAVGWVAEVDGYGYPTSVLWLAANDWAFDEQTKAWRVYGEPVPASRIVHIPWIVPTGKTLGMSPIEHYATIVGAGLSAQEYADVKRGGGLPPVKLRNTQQTLDADLARQIQSRAVKSFASGKPFVHGRDWELDAITIPPNHAQFIETLKLSANQIAAIYGIDPREIGGSASESLTYSTDESRALNRAANMRPYLVRLESAVSRWLPDKQFVKFNVDATIRADIKTRTEVDGAKVADGRLSVNEARAHDELEPIDGGDFHNVPTPKQAGTPNTRTHLAPVADEA